MMCPSFTPKGTIYIHSLCALLSTSSTSPLQADNNTHSSSFFQNKDHETPLHSACQYGHTPVVRLLLEHCCDAAVPNCRGETPLDLASQYGRLDVVELLVRVRPSLLEPYRPDAAAAGERLTHTPLHSAAMNGHR